MAPGTGNPSQTKNYDPFKKNSDSFIKNLGVILILKTLENKQTRPDNTAEWSSIKMATFVTLQLPWLNFGCIDPIANS